MILSPILTTADFKALSSLAETVNVTFPETVPDLSAVNEINTGAVESFGL